ncbi:hypothetical protein N656DRAFT_638377 [Canariomyces notabilis]|uniref:Uncharacterized protein n=1 Tax=Canariomyces notabilis TaxID=2074819 RepID=A0AAN6TFQ9_9PEZI|nr:hypothetical protein N656DRAFT_638377 [Canariomyces arenarius]
MECAFPALEILAEPELEFDSSTLVHGKHEAVLETSKTKATSTLHGVKGGEEVELATTSNRSEGTNETMETTFSGSTKCDEPNPQWPETTGMYKEAFRKPNEPGYMPLTIANVWKLMTGGDQRLSTKRDDMYGMIFSLYPLLKTANPYVADRLANHYASLFCRLEQWEPPMLGIRDETTAVAILRPFVCVCETCASPNDFGSFDEWAGHNDEAHRLHTKCWSDPENLTRDVAT